MELPSRWRLALPSSVTLLGVFCGVFAMIVAPDDAYLAGLAIIGAALCDMVDGRIARLAGAVSPFGAQLDSLADIVSFGIAPALLIYHWGFGGSPEAGPWDPWLLPAFVFVACGAIRLARFNVGEASPSEGFEGIPIPVGALLPTTLMMSSIELDLPQLQDPRVFGAVLLGASLLMVIRVPFRSYKRFRSRVGQVAFYATIAGGLTLLFLRLPGGAVLFGLLALYVAMGLVQRLIGSSEG